MDEGAESATALIKETAYFLTNYCSTKSRPAMPDGICYSFLISNECGAALKVGDLVLLQAPRAYGKFFRFPSAFRAESCICSNHIEFLYFFFQDVFCPFVAWVHSFVVNGFCSHSRPATLSDLAVLCLVLKLRRKQQAEKATVWQATGGCRACMETKTQHAMNNLSFGPGLSNVNPIPTVHRLCR